MAHIRGSHLVVSPDDLEDATMSIHYSRQDQQQQQHRDSQRPEEQQGCIDSLGRYQPAGAKKQWNVTVPMAFAALCASLANCSRGFVLGYSSPSIPELTDAGLLKDDDQTSWYGSLTPIGSLIGALIGGWVTHAWGRKLSTMITCIPLSLGWLAIVGADSVGWLYVGRFLTGVGNGMSSLVTSVYVSEVSSSNARGMLGTINQIAASLGVFIVYTLPFFLDYRWLAVGGGINAAATILLMTAMPETPRWLVSKGRISEAVANFKWLRGCDDNTAQLVVHTLHEEMSKQQQKFHLVELFQCEIFKPFGISLLSMVFQQFTGLFVLLFYTQSIFETVGFSDGKGATAVMGAVMMVAYLFTPLLVERTGRRIMLNISAVGVLICSAILGACLYVREQADHMQYMNGTTTTISPTSSDPTIAVVEQNKSVAYVAVIATVGYMGSYSLGYGPLPWVLISELIPLRARATVGGIAIFITWLLTFVVTKAFAPLSALIGVAGCFWIFTGFSALSLAYVGFLLPETKGRTLEEIEFYFAQGKFPDKVKIKSQVKTTTTTATVA